MQDTKYTWIQVDSTGMQNMVVKAKDWGQEQGIGAKLVLLEQCEGSMTLQFAMTAAQARQMAMAMIAAAESLA